MFTIIVTRCSSVVQFLATRMVDKISETRQHVARHTAKHVRYYLRGNERGPLSEKYDGSVWRHWDQQLWPTGSNNSPSPSPFTLACLWWTKFAFSLLHSTKSIGSVLTFSGLLISKSKVSR